MNLKHFYTAINYCITFLILFIHQFTYAESTTDNTYKFRKLDRKFISLTMENDIVFGDDGGYTNGFALAWGTGMFDHFDQSNTPGWLAALTKNLYINTLPNKHRAISYLIGQSMNTPQDISRKDLIEDQPPYAGMLVSRATLYAFNQKQTDRLTFLLGIVGPASGAEKGQKFIHGITDSEEPMGWQHQLRNEPVFRIEASRSNRLWASKFSDRAEMDLITTKLGGLGNLSSDVGYGFGLRIGSSLVDSFPIATDLPGREVNPTAGMTTRHWIVFMNLSGRYEFNNLLIEGNTFTKSHGVALRHEQLQLSYGVSINLDRWAFMYSAAISTDKYIGQQEKSRFGAVSITYRLD